jgi:methyl-accepting chemotaxis protein
MDDETRERFERIERNLEELTRDGRQMEKNLAALYEQSITHDNQITNNSHQIAENGRHIAALTGVVERLAGVVSQLADEMTETRRQWQAYINRLPRQ